MVKTIEYIPCGGMCNRLMTMASAAQIASTTNINVIVHWNNNKDLSADFSDLFEPINLNNFKVVENSQWLYKSPSRYNYYLPRLFQCICFIKGRYYQPQWGDYSILESIKSKRLLIESFYSIGNIADMRNLFVPKKDILLRINSITQDFKNVIGLHVRRTDHIHAIQTSTDDMFINIIKKEININPEVRFYVATDDETVVTKLKDIFGEARIIHPKLVLSRTSLKVLHPRGGNKIQRTQTPHLSTFC